MDEHWPTQDDLQRARETFGTHEPRDIFYRAATDLVEMARTGQVSVDVAEALTVLLQTWNRSYYRFRPATVRHFEDLEALLSRHQDWLATVRSRSIDSLCGADEQLLREVFTEFENVLGPVGAAKALHLLAPRFLPLWDRKIATAYGLGLGVVGTNGSRYVRFAAITREQVAYVGGEQTVGRNVVKALDEYNYCHFSRRWI